MSQLQLTPEEQAKVERLKANQEATSVSPEWMFVARFGYFYGYEGIKAIMDNQIDFEIAQTLLRGAEKMEARGVVDTANAVYIANIASRSKKGSQLLKKGLAGYVKESKGA